MKRLNMSTILPMWYFVQMCHRTQKIVEATESNRMTPREAYEAVQRLVTEFKEKEHLAKTSSTATAASTVSKEFAHESP